MVNNFNFKTLRQNKVFRQNDKAKVESTKETNNNNCNNNNKQQNDNFYFNFNNLLFLDNNCN